MLSVSQWGSDVMWKSLTFSVERVLGWCVVEPLSLLAIFHILSVVPLASAWIQYMHRR